jgi:hypothetical protein
VISALDSVRLPMSEAVKLYRLSKRRLLSHILDHLFADDDESSHTWV